MEIDRNRPFLSIDFYIGLHYTTGIVRESNRQETRDDSKSRNEHGLYGVLG